jgi:hypothetical protein
MTEYDDRGKVALWRSKSDHPKAPILHGTAYAHRDIREGEMIEIALWRSKSEHPKAPVLNGRLSDAYEEEPQRTQRPPPVPRQTDPFMDDDIPF